MAVDVLAIGGEAGQILRSLQFLEFFLVWRP